MSHPDPSNNGNNYPSDHFRTGGKKPAKKHSLGDKVIYMAKRMKGLQETKHFGSSRRARHKMAKRLAKGEDIF